MTEIPSTDGIEGDLLAKAFASTTASYKITLAKSIFAHVALGGGEFLPYAKLLEGMLRVLWHPVTAYRLRLGHYDRSAEYFAGLSDDQLSGSFEEALPFIDCAVRNPNATILRFPVGVFLKPWFEAAGARSGEPDRPAFHTVTRDRNRGFYLPYEIHPDGILLDRGFMDYILRNLPLLEGWTDMRLVDYLQARNPNIPGIPLKLRAPERSTLGPQRGWWAQLLRAEGFRCIYTGRELGPDGFHLDHFLPWRFVAHDRIWNLVPAAPEINLTKGARIPDPSLVPSLAEAHLHAVRRATETDMPGKDFLDEYLDDLGIEPAMLRDRDAFVRGYQDTVVPLLTLARRRFPSWSPPAPPPPLFHARP